MADNPVVQALINSYMPRPGDEDLIPPAAGYQNPERDINSILSIAGARLNDRLSDAGASIVQALMAPGNALRGEYDQVGIMGDGSVTMTDPRMYDDASELAGLIGLGAMPMPRPSNSLGMFGGMNAKTADLDALKRAKGLWDEGYPLDDIRAQTGWFRGADEQWRFEIPDNAATLNHTQVSLGGASPDTTLPMSQVLQHSELYQAYPELADISATLRMDAGLPDGTYYAPRTVGKRVVEGVSGQAPTRNDLKSVALHELQHAIQQREGFAPGSSPNALGIPQDDLWAAAKRAYLESDQDAAILRELGIKTPDVQLKPWDELTQREQLEWLQRGRDSLYYRSAGEVEARNVQTRMDMTPEQRRAQSPWTTQDVPDNLQIIRMLIAGGGR